MKVIPANSKIGYRDDFRNFLKLKRYEKKCPDFVLVEGTFEKSHQWEQYSFSKRQLNKILKKKIVRLEIEEPNKFFLNDNPDSYDFYFDKILTICPYTAKWLNKRQKNNKRIPIFYPTNEEYIPKKTKKIYDIIYVGNVVSKKILDDVRTISKFNYRFVSFSKNSLVTNRDVSYEDKLMLISQSKIALVHNLLFVRPYHILSVWREKDWQKNEAFKLIPPWYYFWKIVTNRNIVVPQAKTRLFESALSRSLILCKKDPFNIIERYFEPGKEFLYYEDGKLEETIHKILKNYSKYKKIVDNAYNKARKNYTTKALVKNYLSKINFHSFINSTST